MGNLIDCLRRVVLAGGETDLTDGQLLECFVSRQEEAALAALVRRHGPMVWGVCRRVLRNHQDVEDAFQATFLVLVRRAASIVPREMVGNWLYGVAHQTARKARATMAKRQAREKQVPQMPEPEAVPEPGLWHDLEPLLDQELSRLPDKYRAALVLCDLEGKTRKEAARQLKIPEGTLSSRLTTARTMLAKRLARHGLAVPGGALAAVVSQKAASAGVPTSVVSVTIKAASLFAAGQAAAVGVISAKVAALAEGVLKTMLLKKMTVVAAVLSVVVALSGAAGLIYHTHAAEQPKVPKDAERDIHAAFRPSAAKVPVPKKGFPNAVGWSWFEAPRLRTTFGDSCSITCSEGTGFSAIFAEDKKDGAFFVYLAYEMNKKALEYRPVVFDKEGKRYPLSVDPGTNHHKVFLNRFRLDPKKLPLDKAVYLGIEMLTPEGKKDIARAVAAYCR